MSAADSDNQPRSTTVALNGDRGRAYLWLLGLLLVAAVIAAGGRGLNSPWIQGDEYIFIANNPDVTGVGAATGPSGNRWIDIFFHTHEDLYQPMAILSYAVEWSLWGDHCVFQARLTDVLIHLLNALLLWAALSALLRRLCPDNARAAAPVAWSLAFVWALHPMLVSAYAADMGRTHLLAATFALASLLLHLRSLRPSGWPWFIAACLALLAAMLSKPIVGWVVIVLTLELTLLGWRRTFRSPRIYVVAAICVFFALLTLRTTSENLLLDDSPMPLFGDPLSRAALNLWISLRNFAAPLWRLSPWYPPDVHTGWSYAPVWAGAALTAIAGVAVIVTARRPKLRGVALGLVWCCAMWLPVSGLVAAREQAARDRYFYLPAAGLLLAVGVLLLRWIGRTSETSRRRVFLIGLIAVVLGAAALPWDMRLAATWRDTLLRAEQAAKLDTDDPRLAEFVAVARQFASGHRPAESQPPDAGDPLEQTVGAYRRASRLAEQHPWYFPDAHSRAAFHRRLAFSLWNLRQYKASLSEARLAEEFEPDAPLTWLRLAHAYRALQRWPETRQAYERLFEVLPADAPDRALRAVEFGDLLLNRFLDPTAALPYFREAVPDRDLSREAQRLAFLGAAHCEVLVGSPNDGFQLALEVLRAEPENTEAASIIALYHLRGGRWDKARAISGELLSRDPANYENLRGFQNACAELGEWSEASRAWRRATRADPENLVLRSFATWSAACANEEDAADAAARLLADSPNNRFACLANAILHVRAGEFDQAHEWVQRSRAGAPLPLAREYTRTAAALRVMLEREEEPPETALIRAALLFQIGEGEQARRLISEFEQRYPTSDWRNLAKRIRRDAAPAPAAP